MVDNESCVIVGVQATAARMSQETVAAQDMLTGFAEWQGRAPESVAADTTWDSITPAAWKLIQQQHHFCFAPCPGFVDCRADSENLIWRTEIEVSYSAAEFRVN
jgi:hypothetical protein